MIQLRYLQEMQRLLIVNRGIWGSISVAGNSTFNLVPKKIVGERLGWNSSCWNSTRRVGVGSPSFFSLTRSFASSSIPPPHPPLNDEEEPKKKLTKGELMAKYGPVFLVYWTSAWVLSGGMVYLGVEMLGDDTAFKVAKSCYIDRIVDLENLDPRYGNLALAIAINEALEIVRLPIVAATTPRIARVVERVTGKSLERKPGKFATLIKDYGPLGVGYYFTLWTTMLGATYMGIDHYGAEAAIDVLHHVIDSIRYIGLDKIIPVDSFNPSSINPSVGNIALALLLNEMMEVVRLPFIVATLPVLKRMITKN